MDRDTTIPEKYKENFDYPSEVGKVVVTSTNY
jgi:hypothetical protein